MIDKEGKERRTGKVARMAERVKREGGEESEEHRDMKSREIYKCIRVVYLRPREQLIVSDSGLVD